MSNTWRGKVEDKQMADRHNTQGKTIRERMAEEELLQEKTDSQGRRWRKLYFGGGEHSKNWSAQVQRDRGGNGRGLKQGMA